MTGLEFIRDPNANAGEIASLISRQCPPTIPENCDHLACRDCWLAWLINVPQKSETVFRIITREQV